MYGGNNGCGFGWGSTDQDECLWVSNREREGAFRADSTFAGTSDEDLGLSLVAIIGVGEGK